MASTSVHLPADLLERLNRLATSTGRSRNRLIVEACEAFLSRQAGEWPAGFFSPDRLNPEELGELRDGGAEMLAIIEASRRSRRRRPFNTRRFAPIDGLAVDDWSAPAP